MGPSLDHIRIDSYGKHTMIAPSTALLSALTLILTLLGCDRPAAPPVAKEGGPQRSQVIVAAGDSLSAGFGVAEPDNYPSQLDKRLQAAGLDYRVVNAGVSGETSSGLLSRLDWLLSLNPAIVILETGANDGLRGVDPTLTKENMRKIIRLLQERRITIILAGMRMVYNLGPDYTEAFNRIYPELAREFDLLFIPFVLEGVAANPALNIEDGIHPNRDGYRILVDTLYPFVLQAIELRKGQTPPAGSPPPASPQGTP